LKSYNDKIQCIAVQPDVAIHGIEGIKHLESAMVPKIYDPKVPDRFIEVSTETAYHYTVKLPRNEGLLLGISASANIYAALKVAKELTDRNESGVMSAYFVMAV
jgi:cysteine synthase (EC 2.5.1.47)